MTATEFIPGRGDDVTISKLTWKEDHVFVQNIAFVTPCLNSSGASQTVYIGMKSSLPEQKLQRGMNLEFLI